MQQESKETLFNHMIDFLATFYHVTRNTLKLFALECQLAQRSLLIIITYILLLTILGLSGWIMMLSLFILLLHSLIGGWLLPISITLSVNLLFIALGCWKIAVYTKNLHFSYTRKHLFQKRNQGIAHAHFTAAKTDSIRG